MVFLLETLPVIPLEKGLSNFTVSLSSCSNNKFLFSCPQEGDAPLIEAAIGGHESIVVLLLQHKADPNISDEVSTDTVSVRVVHVYHLWSHDMSCGHTCIRLQ